MLDPDDLAVLREAIHTCAGNDRRVLDALREEVKVLTPKVRLIRPRTTTAVSLVASDGGNNSLEFDPFLFQVVRVVDSCGKQLCLDVVSPTTDTDRLSSRQFDAAGRPLTDLGFLMDRVGVKSRHLHELSPMIPTGDKVRESPERVGTSWVQVYRDLVEWAVLYRLIVDTRFGSDTLIVRDGLLRSKIFSGSLFMDMMEDIEKSIGDAKTRHRRSIYLVGVAKHSKVLQRYQMALALENVIPPGDARFVPIPTELEAKAYRWAEWARGREDVGDQSEPAKFKAGQMFFVRFGRSASDPIWTIDILDSQAERAQEVFGYLLADAINGFPVPYYPRCLQTAHEFAQLAGFDTDIVQREVLEAVRNLLPRDRRPILDVAQLDAADLSQRRYG